MKPSRMSAQVFLELPPVLSHYLEQDRNTWLDGSPRQGRLALRERQGLFHDLESLSHERAGIVGNLGVESARALVYRVGCGVGARDAIRHLAEVNGNVRLALQSAMVYWQLEGRGTASEERFEFDLNARTLYREVIVKGSPEAAVASEWSDGKAAACWFLAGYLCGHVGALLDVRVLTIEQECAARGAKACRFITRLEGEWGDEASWERDALAASSVAEEVAGLREAARVAQESERRMRRSYEDIQRRLRSELLLEDLVAECDAMRAVVQRARLVTPNEASVLLLGENGTGRESLARAIHCAGPRKAKPFISVDCSALSGQLLLQELFGYAKDGVAGALREYTGAFVRAHGGTLYLADVGSLTLDAQLRLLRAMREKQVFPLGAETASKADVRVIGSSVHDLTSAVAKRQFLEPLYYALGVVTIDLPPLRDREDDALLMAERFLHEFAERYQRPDLALSSEFRESITDCSWPGNVRQLRRTMEHAVATATGSVLGLANLPEDVLAERRRRSQEELAPETIRAALKRTHGNRGRAAELLGISRTSLWRAMRRVGMQ